MAGEWGMGSKAEVAAYQAKCEHFWAYTKGGRICLDCKKCEDLTESAGNGVVPKTPRNFQVKLAKGEAG